MPSENEKSLQPSKEEIVFDELFAQNISLLVSDEILHMQYQYARGSMSDLLRKKGVPVEHFDSYDINHKIRGLYIWYQGEWHTLGWAENR